MDAEHSPEFELLLACARLQPAAGDEERIRPLAANEFDCERFLELAWRHGLGPIVFRRLNALGREVLPRAAFIDLWARYERNAVRNKVQTTALLDVLELFESNAIEALPFKGPALAAAVYRDVALREFVDLDILVRQRDVLPAKRLLEKRGYVSGDHLTTAAERAMLDSFLYRHLVMVEPRTGVMLELHWKTDADFPVEAADEDSWWSGLPREHLEGVQIRSFEPEALLLVLCIHGSKHAWSRLIWLLDVAELIRQRAALDWDWIFNKADSLQCRRRLDIGLYLAATLLDAPLPERVRRRLVPETTLTRSMEKIVSQISHPEPRALGALQRLRLKCALYDRLGQRISHCLNVVLAPTLVEWSRWPLPRPLFFMYVPLRIGRLFAKYVFKKAGEWR